MVGGDNGGTASSWELAILSTANSKAFLAVEWVPIFLVDGSDLDASAFDELLLSMDAKNFFFDKDCGADAMIELNTPDSFRPWMMTWNT